MGGNARSETRDRSEIAAGRCEHSRAELTRRSLPPEVSLTYAKVAWP